MKMRRFEQVAKIYGIGFDDTDGHTRVTEGDGFKVVQGSEETHDEMQAICLKIDEKLRERGCRMEDLTKEQIIELLQSID